MQIHDRAMMRMSLHSRLLARITRWTRRRYGIDSDPTQISPRRVYILPTRLGAMYALTTFAMVLGGMNYGNNLALALAFTLGSLGLVAMHHCHRNLAALRIASASNAPVFSGQRARFNIAVENPSAVARHDISAGHGASHAEPARIEPTSRALLRIDIAAPRRGWLVLEHFTVSTRYPFGLFRAWTVLHMGNKCLVYPRPSPPGDPPPANSDAGSGQQVQKGDDDFAGFRSFQVSDSPRRIAWKAYAREQGLLVKQYAGTGVTSHVFDWDSLPGLDAESRLARLCRWILDAHAAGVAYGLRLPGFSAAPAIGVTHREHCLSALALFDAHARA